MAILEQDIPKVGDSGLPEAVSDAVAKALERDRDRRFDSAQSFAEALERATPTEPMSAKQVAAFMETLPPLPSKHNKNSPNVTVTTDGQQPARTVIDKAPTPLPVMAAIPRSSPSERISEVVPEAADISASPSMLWMIIGSVLFFAAVAAAAYLLAS